MRSGARPSRAPRLIDIAWGDPSRSEDHAGRQGRVLRHRRPRHQAVERHADHEEGHGRRRLRARARPHGHGPPPAGAPARADPGGGERDLRQRLPSARRLPLAQGHHGRDRQHRRGRPPDPGRRARARRRGGARPDRRHGDADRRRPRRARSATCRRSTPTTMRSPPSSPAMRRPRTIRCGACRCGGPTTSCSSSKTADVNNISSSPHGGSITAALFLRRFVEQAKAWLHLDIYAWTPAAKSGRPEGGECQAARALYALLSERYSALKRLANRAQPAK